MVISIFDIFFFSFLGLVCSKKRQVPCKSCRYTAYGVKQPNFFCACYTFQASVVCRGSIHGIHLTFSKAFRFTLSTGEKLSFWAKKIWKICRQEKVPADPRLNPRLHGFSCSQRGISSSHKRRYAARVQASGQPYGLKSRPGYPSRSGWSDRRLDHSHGDDQ